MFYLLCCDQILRSKISYKNFNVKHRMKLILFQFHYFIFFADNNVGLVSVSESEIPFGNDSNGENEDNTHTDGNTFGTILDIRTDSPESYSSKTTVKVLYIS